MVGVAAFVLLKAAFMVLFAGDHRHSKAERRKT
jgi:hypothetical protein